MTINNVSKKSICPTDDKLDSPVHSISMSVCFLFVPPGPESDFMEDPPDEEEEDDRDEGGLSTASSRGPIFDCFLSLSDDNELLDQICFCLSYNSLFD